MTSQETKVDIAELKGHVCDIASGGSQADLYTKTTKVIGQCVGRVHGQEMKVLVTQGEEAGPTEPDCPTNGGDKAKAIWSKECDLCVKKRERCASDKGKAFAAIVGQTAKAMKNRVEADERFGTAEKDSSVKTSLEAIEGLAFSASDLKCPHMQAAQAWQDLAMAHQQEDKDVVDHYRRHINMVESVEMNYGEMAPVKVAEKDTRHLKNKAKVVEDEKEKFLAFMFLNGANKKTFGCLLKNLKNGFTLGNNEHPSTMEDALQALAMNLPREKLGSKSDTQIKKTSFNQVAGSQQKCWHCKGEDHIKKDCPKRKKDLEEKKEKESEKKKAGWSGLQVERERVAWCG